MLRSWIKEKVRDLLRAVPDGPKNIAHLLEDAEPDDEDTPSQEKLNLMSKEDLITALTNGKKPWLNKNRPGYAKLRQPQRDRDAAPRCNNDKTCPNCKRRPKE